MAKKKNKEESIVSQVVLDDKKELSDIKEIEIDSDINSESLDNEEIKIEPIELNLDDISESIFNENINVPQNETTNVNKTTKTLINRLFGRIWNGQVYD